MFDGQRAELETRNLERKTEAEAAASKLDGQTFVLIRQASETGALYGSVSARDIAGAASDDGVHIERGQVRLEKPIKSLGVTGVRIVMHPEVSANINVNVARSEDEAERQARGENVLAPADEHAEEDAVETAPEFFDESAQAPVEGEDENDVAESDNA